jgi:protein XagA
LRAWRSLLNCLLLAAAGIECRGVEPAFAGAWLLAPGEGRAIVYSVFSESSQAYDFQGRLIYEPQYRKFELGTYIEYGVTDWLTLVISPAYDRIRGHPFNPSLPSLKPPPGRSYNGGGESAAAARIRLYQNENNVLSFQAGLQTKGASLAGPLSPFELRRAPSLELRTAAGTSATIFGKESFIDAEAAYRFYAKEPGEWRFDLTFGIRPVPGMLLMLQNFASFTKAPPIFPQWVLTNGSSKYDRSWSDKLQPSIVFDITPQWSIQAGSFFTVAGKNAGREFGPLIGVWYKF